MIAYFDTSAIIPLLIEEPGSPTAAAVWQSADHVLSVRLVYAEARAALAQAARVGRLPAADHATAVKDLDHIYTQVDRVDIDDALVARAGELAESLALRGYDAVHLAAAECISDSEMVLVSGDDALCSAAISLGLAIART